MALLDGKGISSKVKVPTNVGLFVGAAMMMVSSFGIELPLDEDQILEAVAAGIFLWSTISGVIGWYVKERNPAQSSIDAVEANYRIVEPGGHEIAPALTVPVPASADAARARGG